MEQNVEEANKKQRVAKPSFRLRNSPFGHNWPILFFFRFQTDDRNIVVFGHRCVMKNDIAVFVLKGELAAFIPEQGGRFEFLCAVGNGDKTFPGGVMEKQIIIFILLKQISMEVVVLN